MLPEVALAGRFTAVFGDAIRSGAQAGRHGRGRQANSHHDLVGRDPHAVVGGHLKRQGLLAQRRHERRGGRGLIGEVHQLSLKLHPTHDEGPTRRAGAHQAIELNGEAAQGLLIGAGADQEALRGFTVQLDGLVSASPSGRPFVMRWVQLQGELVHLSNETSPAPTFVAPLSEQTLTFQVTADDGVWITTDEVMVRIRLAPSSVAPRLRAGPDRIAEDSGETPSERDLGEHPPADVATAWEEVSPELSPE